MAWVYVFVMNWWTYPETGVTILDEDMPAELRPE